MSKQTLNEKKSSKISLKRMIASLCSSGKNFDESTIIDQPISRNQLKKQCAHINLNMPTAILEETSQFDESQQYFLIPSPEIKRTVKSKLTSTVIETTFGYDAEIDYPVSISQISSPPKRQIECESFVDRYCSVLCFDNPLCDTIIEEEDIDQETAFKTGVINLSNTDKFIESYGFTSNQFQTANTFLFSTNDESVQEVFV